MGQRVMRAGGIAALALALAACSNGGSTTSGGGGTTSASGSNATSAASGTSMSSGSAGGGTTVGFHPAPLTSWQWQLSGTLDTTVDVPVYDVDMIETSDAELATLKSAGRKVICYFSAGSYEPGRPDSNAFQPADVGNDLVGWPGEKWLDTRSAGVRSIMKARLDVAKSRGCDAVEPDNVDAYANDSGFPLTADTQLDYNRFLANEAHARGLSVGLKNDVDQLIDLEPSFDWALNEECFTYSECDGYASTFVAAEKAVFQTEYVDASQLDAVCAVTKPLGLSTILKDLDLDAYRVACP
jgi:hypothetical protein